ncbi:MAG: glycerate kinase [Muribaculum sp.]|nr:glycerate kinase [Muribaculum sp.]
MKIVLAFDKYKGCMTASQLCKVASKALRSRFGESVEIISMPMSDGGEGMRDILGNIYRDCQQSPCFIETAEWCGLSGLAPNERNPAERSTYPLGEAIVAALREGARHFVVGLGGSATNDAGTGMLQALGYKFYDRRGQLIKPCLCGRLLSSIASIDGSGALPELKEADFTAICDVDAPLYGPKGAAFTFAPQKGASPEMVEMLDRGLRCFAKVAGGIAADIPGDGAAGGLGFCLRVFMGARMMPGAEYVMSAYGFDQAIEGADMIITGEGRSDQQTLMGKVPAAVLAHGLRSGVPVCLMSGAVEVSAHQSLLHAGFAQVVAITPDDIPLPEATLPAVATKNLTDTVRNQLRLAQ